MRYFVTEMCTCLHISVTKWCSVQYLMHCGYCDMGLLQGRYIDSLEQSYCKSSVAAAIELSQFCAKPSICLLKIIHLAFIYFF